MATILTFDTSRCRRALELPPGLRTLNGEAEILMFTGVRREPLHSRPAPHAPRLYEPMFNDPAPHKPGGKKRRRGKTG